MIRSFGLTAHDIKNYVEGKKVKAPIKHAANALGLAFKLPLGQPGKMAQGIRDIQTGEKEGPKDILQMINFILQGQVEETKRRKTW